MMELHGKGDNAQNVHCPLFRCSSSARTVQEASDSEADWEQSTAYQYWDVVPPLGLSMKQAQCAQLSGCSRRCISIGM